MKIGLSEGPNSSITMHSLHDRRYIETDHPWAASAVEAAQGLLAAADEQLQKLPMDGHLCTGSPWVKSVLTHWQFLITHGQTLILPVGSVPTAHW